MEKKTGKINVQTENIFPIIKKFLYSDHDIFLRELISNAVDATQKLKTLASFGHFKGELGDLTIKVTLDTKKKKLTISDKGIGMTSEEVEKFINEIAFSSAEEFVKKFKTQSQAELNQIIGHFGLGFYSAFMVSDKVELFSKTYKKGGNTKAIKWECDGSPNYTMVEDDKSERGTDVVLYLSKDSEDFTEEYKILQILKKYCKFLPVPIQFGTEKVTEEIEGEKDKDGNPKTKEVEKPRIINNTNPAWKRKPAELKEEDYKEFYRELYPMNFEEPLFNIHLNIDYPFNLTGILYFPKLKKNLEVQRDKIQLYSNQVFITDSVEGIVPDFLTLLHGVIDSPDIPLNVSRSYLQSDSNVKKISSHITKKVGDKLEEIFKKDRPDFEKKWDNIKIFIEYGMITDEKFYDQSTKFCLLKNTENQYFTFEEYEKKVKDIQKDKNKKIVYLYTTDVQEQHSFILTARERGYDVLIMDGALDSHFINHLERKFKDTTFARVDAEVIDKLIQKEEDLPSKLSEEEKNKLKPVLEKFVEKEKFHVLFESLSEKEQPVIITQPEFMRRMKDMSKVGGGGMMYFNEMPETFNMIINSNHPLIGKILNESDETKQNELAKQTIDLALLSQNMLKGEDLTNFVKRSIELIK